MCQEKVKVLALQEGVSVKLLMLLMPRDSVLRWLRLLQVPVSLLQLPFGARTPTHPPTHTSACVSAQTAGGRSRI